MEDNMINNIPTAAPKDCMVTVMCTAYNHEAYIREALESIVSQQTDFPFELLVNDDCSTDGTAAIIKEYEEKYPDIVRPFYQEKNLFSQNRDIYYEVFFPNARGKYVAFCEGDDRWCDVTKLQRQVDYLEAHPDYSACVHNTVLHYCAGDKPDGILVSRDADCDMGFSEVLPGMNHAWHTSSVLAKTAILANPPDYYYVAADYGFGDYPYGLWLLENGPVHFLNRAMSVYRLDSNPYAWSTGVHSQFDKLNRFYTGVLAMLRCFRIHVTDEKLLDMVDERILDASFNLLYIQGKDKELRKEPYRRLLRTKPLKFRATNFVKSTFPILHQKYRRYKGYTE